MAFFSLFSSHGFFGKTKKKLEQWREKPPARNTKAHWTLHASWIPTLLTPDWWHLATLAFGAKLLWRVDAIYYACFVVRGAQFECTKVRRESLAMPHDLSAKVEMGRLRTSKLLIFLWDSIGSRNEGWLACVESARRHSTIIFPYREWYWTVIQTCT